MKNLTSFQKGIFVCLLMLCSILGYHSIIYSKWGNSSQHAYDVKVAELNKSSEYRADLEDKYNELVDDYNKEVSRHSTYSWLDIHKYKSKITKPPVEKPVVTKTKVRVGARCCDGSRSYATGRGACSHHGGVCEWLYDYK